MKKNLQKHKKHTNMTGIQYFYSAVAGLGDIDKIKYHDIFNQTS